MKKINKIIISLSSIISISSMPLIAASCSNKNPTDESIINNITPQTIDNQKQEDKSKEKEQEENPSGSGSSSSNTAPQTQGNQNHKNPSGSDSSSPDTTTNQDKQKQEYKNKKEEKDDPEKLLKKLEEVKKDYEKAKEGKEGLIKKSRYYDDLNSWFGDIHHSRFGSRGSWNYYLDFETKVRKKQNPESYFKIVKEFIKKYETEIKKYLEENLLIEK
ncbi:variable surface lipoprotein [Metamycoplasma alkalescens]|uniref:Lipoprotein n=2 Tax=Metamycoplasma alkalescens TaxID=45363 RepID=A0A318U5S9_9BACT|nr:variable surface lipoprotein [Metamycoplasma alkalescens]PYF42550.1 hypothetical protein BCF88_1105 [Metamycoplasma alkalescens]